MQRRESIAQLGAQLAVAFGVSARSTNASVGHASMHREQVPQRSGGGTSGAISSDVMSSPRKNQDPSGSLIRHVFFPIHPSPASRAKVRSSTGAVSTQILYSNPPPSPAAIS